MASNDNTKLSTITLSELLKHILSNFIPILLFTIIPVFCVILVGTISNDKYNIKDRYEIKSINNLSCFNSMEIPYYTPNLIFDELNSPYIQEQALKKLDLDSNDIYMLKNNLKISIDLNSNIITFYAKEITDPEMYRSYIYELLETIAQRPYLQTSNQIETTITDIDNQLNTLASMEITTDLVPFMTKLRQVRNSLSKQLSILENPIVNVIPFAVSKLPSKYLSIEMFIISGALGFLLGLFYTLCTYLFSNRIYTSKDMLKVIDRDRFIGALPILKDNSNQIKLDNLILKLPPSTEKLLVSSISSKSGKTFLTDNLKKNKILENMDIVKLDTIYESSNDIINISANTTLIILISAGKDTIDTLQILDDTMSQANVNVKYILNFSNIRDIYSEMFEDKQTFIRRKILISNRRFYKKLYR